MCRAKACSCSAPALLALLPQFKILRNAYAPLPPHYSRPFQSLVNTMLRADPHDRPGTQDLLALAIVKKHLFLLMGQQAPVHAPGMSQVLGPGMTLGPLPSKAGATARCAGVHQGLITRDF